MPNSFKNRIAKFWKDFAEEEYQIREMMDNKVEGEILLNFVDSVLQIAFNQIYFEMGINKDGKYELILTPEGDRTRLMLIHYWYTQAPDKLWDKWNFYYAKPAHGKQGSRMAMHGIDIGDEDITIYPEIDIDRRKVNIEIYSPKLMELEENKRFSMFFIYLDQFIGELYTMEYIGYIDFAEEKLKKESIQITGFKNTINDAIDDNDWPMFENPCEIYSGYRMDPKEDRDWTLREDVLSGYTSSTIVLNEFYNKETTRFDEAKENGLRFGFLFFENANIPKEDIVNFRGEIEDKMIAQIKPYGIANCLGGATGFHFSYIDFIIYDYEAFLPTAKEVLRAYGFDEKGYSDFIFGAEPVLLN